MRKLSDQVKSRFQQGRLWGPDVAEVQGHIERRHTAPWREHHKQNPAQAVYHEWNANDLTAAPKRDLAERGGVFGSAMTGDALQGAVERAAAEGVWMTGRGGYASVTADLGQIVGHDSNGKATQWLTAIVEPGGQLRTAFPSSAKGPNLERFVAENAVQAPSAAPTLASRPSFALDL